MYVRDFDLRRFVTSVYGTKPFAEYCRVRGIAFDMPEGGLPHARDQRRWVAALARLSPVRRSRVEDELARVNELAGREGVAHLLETAHVRPPEHVPFGAPLALWFFLSNSPLFDEVYFHHEVREIRSWRIARAVPGVTLDNLPQKARALEAGLRTLFRLGAKRFCTVEARHCQNTSCFTARVADRIRLVEWFTPRGRIAAGRVRLACALHFAYNPTDGLVMVDSTLRPVDRINELLSCFASTVLMAPIEECADVFNLDRLKDPFHPPPDDPDMELVRVRHLALRYPARRGSRQVKLETLSSDAPTAIEELLRDHFGGTITAHELRVAHAELQVRLRIGGRGKTYLVRLWPDRCNLSHTPIGTRLWGCLRRWGLCHA